MNISNILIFNPFGIGDVLFTTPLAVNLKEHLPHSSITYLCNRRTYPLLKNAPFIDSVFVFEKDEWRSLGQRSKSGFIKQLVSFYNTIRRNRYDVLFDLSLNSQYGLFFKLAGIPMRIGFDYKKRGRFLTHSLPLDSGYSSQHVVRYHLSLLSFLGISPTAYPLALGIADEAVKSISNLLAKYGYVLDRPFVIVCPGSGDSWQSTAYYRQWPQEHFLRLIQMLIEKEGLQIILCGSNSERPICDYIAAKVSGHLLNLCGRIDLNEFCALVSRCTLMITNDGGPFHIAQALRKNTAVFFGPQNEMVYGAYPDESLCLVLRCNVSCRPCYKAFRFPGCEFDKRCLREITPEAAFAAIKSKFLK